VHQSTVAVSLCLCVTVTVPTVSLWPLAGGWELITLYRGAVGVTVTNNYFAQLFVHGVRQCVPVSLYALAGGWELITLYRGAVGVTVSLRQCVSVSMCDCVTV